MTFRRPGDWQDALRAFSLTMARAGKRIAASNAIIAITINNSIRVKPPDLVADS